MLDEQLITVRLEDPVAWVAFNRPQHANCLNGAMFKELKAVFNTLDEMDAVRAVVLGGRGRHFCAGIDLNYLLTVKQKISAMPKGDKQDQLYRLIVELQTSVNAIEKCRKPVLAAIQGVCYGAGLDIAAACDLRYAASDARFSVKEVDLAIVADLGSLQRLPGIVGQGITRELAFTGREFKGEEALGMGLLNGLFASKSELTEKITALAAELAQKSSLALHGIKATLNHSRDHSVGDGLDYVALRNAAMLLSKDLDKAMAAYLDKPSPELKD